MNTETMDTLIGYFKEAQTSEHGVRIPSSNGEALRRKLYKIRRQNPEFKGLVLRLSPYSHDEVWILKAYDPHHR